MIVSWLMVAACLLIQAGNTLAGVNIPDHRRIEAKVVRTLIAPTTQPMHMPTDVAVNSKGRVFIADGTNDRILQFDNGKFEVAVQQAGTVGLTFDAKDQLWVTDAQQHRLLVLDADGKLIESIDLPSGEKHPCNPTDVAVTRDGKRTYVVDNDSHRILIRDNQTKTFEPLGRFGEAVGQFRWPFMLCIGEDGYVYVSEAIGARVQRISPKNQWAGLIGKWGVELGQLYRPKGIAIDARGHLYISDSTLGVIQVFGERGNLQGILTNAQGEPLRFKHPMGMCFDPSALPDDRLYVVELGADRVAVVSFPKRGTP